MPTHSPQHSLPADIQAFRQALQRTKQIDGATREALLSLQQDIDRVLDEQDEIPLGDRLEELAVRFENEHPAVGNALRQAIDALAKAGM